MVCDNRVVPKALAGGRNGVERGEDSDNAMRNTGESCVILLVVHFGRFSGFCHIFSIKAARTYVHQVYGKKYRQFFILAKATRDAYSVDSKFGITAWLRCAWESKPLIPYHPV